MAWVEGGQFFLQWPPDDSDLANYHYWIAQPPQEAPSTLWVEWTFRSNMPFDPNQPGCDGRFSIKYKELSDSVLLHGDAVVSFAWDIVVSGLELDELHTYRFESLDGLNYQFSVDGLVFEESTGQGGNGFNYLQFSGRGDCPRTVVQTMTNGWSYVRYGTLGSGEAIVSADPPAGFLNPDNYAGLDRFTIMFDQPGYVYIDDITAAVSAGPVPAVIKTWRLDAHGPETLEVVLDRPLTVGETTRFTINTGGTPQIVEYTLAKQIPAASTWGLLATGLTLLIAGTIVVKKT